jgi:chromosomal replication initiation ATPase DnaA
VNVDRQLLLRFEHRPSLTGDDFYVADGNRIAVLWIDRWPGWTTPALAIYGPAGCGKTHLAQVFLARTGGRSLTAEDLSARAPHDLMEGVPACVVDDADRAVAAGHERPLLHLYNTVKETGRLMLVTSRLPPSRWTVRLADLRSRLNAAAAIPIAEPDDTLMKAVLVKMFSDRQLRVHEDVLAFMLTRMERSFAAARDLVARVDEKALRTKRNVSVSLVSEILGNWEALEEEGDV